MSMSSGFVNLGRGSLYRSPKKTSGGRIHFRVASLNVRGVRGHERDLEALFWGERLDVLCLQDTRLQAAPLWNRRALSMECVRFHSMNVAGSLAILYRPCLEVSVKRLAEEGCAAIRVRLEDEDLWMACCYARPGRILEMQRIREALVSTEGERGGSLLIALGDFNAKFRGECASTVTDAHEEELHKLCLELGMRKLPSPGPTTQYGTAVDHCMVPHGVDATWERIGRNSANSDHFPMVCTLWSQAAPVRASVGRCWKAHRFLKQRELIKEELRKGLLKIRIPGTPSNHRKYRQFSQPVDTA